MVERPRLFWDASALIDASLASDESPYHDLFGLAEAGAIDMRWSPDVGREVEGVLRRYSADARRALAIALHEAHFATTLPPNEDTVNYCEGLTGYRPDARILAAAEECRADILVTHDRTHSIGNPLISPPDTHCRAMTASAALEWCLRRLTHNASTDQP